MALNLRIDNQTLVGSHFPLTYLKDSARITADSAAASGTLTVDNIAGFSIGQYLLLGNFGEPTAEIVRIHTSTVPSGTTITLNANTVYDHYVDTPVTVLDFNQIEFSRATTTTGTKVVLGSVMNIAANRKATAYNDLTNSTGYGFYRFKNAASGVFSGYSDAVIYTGNPYNSVEQIALQAVADCGNELNDGYCNENDLIKDVQQAQDAVESVRDWPFEIVSDTSSISTTQGENTYSVDSLTYALKYPDSKQAIIALRIGNRTLDYIDLQKLQDIIQWTNQSTLAADATVGATSVTLSDSSSFTDTGTVYLRTNGYVSYTANDTATNILSGISASAITTLVASGATVWQNMSVGTPLRYTVFNNNIIVDTPPDETNAGIAFKIDYIRRLPRLTSFASTTEVPFPEAMTYFVAHKIQLRKRNLDEAQKYLELFTAHVSAQSSRYKLPAAVSHKYFITQNTAKEVSVDMLTNSDS